ncbi:DHH family phosphoesterase [Antrihabitans cavernicola]|uniref:Bifunctional oligoribonuclease/PAP phosphatase NrnA n=1 Tax=Antrihabitans cavernicola TaxID=2495913 RepID=A0A5A7SCJ5_9NOCA|nr:bifunctional oligoribonuclease/PAP phosphatase NrnA [Spelaeibacter cavernicola]KAA0023294.1 bifunctional oligoribonuclease/PAP phosphatase NrnA [Spelaeibacter cavernicola]
MTATGSSAVDEPFGDDQLKVAVDAFEAATSVTVLCHVQPDADTIGSGLALGLALERRGIAVQVSFAEPDRLPASMRDLPGTDLLVPADEVARAVDLIVTVDCGSTGRLGSLADRLDGADTVLVIDHHRSNTRFGTVNVIDVKAESTTAVLARIFDLWDTEIDRDIAHCLYAGLVTDTGSFRWVRPGTHVLAERLLATGIDGGAIARTLLDNHPFGWLPMLSTVLGSAQLVADAHGGDGLVYAVVRRADVEGLGSEEIESIIDIVRTATEAEVAAVFKETEASTRHEWAVSLRSKNAVDVSTVATGLGGGGHRFAAGYTASGPIEDLVASLCAALG